MVHSVPTAVALTAPACRCVVVEAWVNLGEPDTTGHVVMPVVAIQSALDAEGVHPQPLVIDPSYGLVELQFLKNAVNVAHRVVACPWPTAEDAERFAPVIAELTAKAREQAVEERDRRAARQDLARLRKPLLTGAAR